MVATLKLAFKNEAAARKMFLAHSSPEFRSSVIGGMRAVPMTEFKAQLGVKKHAEEHHGLEPGDILLGHRRAKTGPADWMTAAIIEKVQGTPYGHAAMYVGDGEIVHAHRTLPKEGVTKIPLEQFKELYDFKAYRVHAPEEDRHAAAHFVKNEVGKGYSTAKMYGAVIPRSLGTPSAEKKERLAARSNPEFMCSELIAAAYPDKVFAGQPLAATKPVDLGKSRNTKLVAEFKKEASIHDFFVVSS